MTLEKYLISFVFLFALILCISSVNSTNPENITTPNIICDVDTNTINTEDVEKPISTIDKKDNQKIDTIKKSKTESNKNIKSNNLKQENTTNPQINIEKNTITTKKQSNKSLKQDPVIPEVIMDNLTVEYGDGVTFPIVLNPLPKDGFIFIYFGNELMELHNLSLGAPTITVRARDLELRPPGQYPIRVTLSGSSEYSDFTDSSHTFTFYANSTLITNTTNIEFNDKINSTTIPLKVTTPAEDVIILERGNIEFYVNNILISNQTYEEDYTLTLTNQMLVDNGITAGSYNWNAIYKNKNTYLRPGLIGGILKLRSDMILTTNPEYKVNVNEMVEIPVTLNPEVNEGTLTVGYGGSIDYEIDLSNNNPVLFFDTTNYMPGEYELIINYTNSQNYNDASTKTILKIYQPTKITPSKTSINFRVGEGNTDETTFIIDKDYFGDDIRGSVEVYLDDNIIDSLTVGDTSSALLDLNDNLLRGVNPGYHSIKALFVTGDEYYLESETNIDLYVSGDVKLELPDRIIANITDNIEIPVVVTYNQDEVKEGTLNYYVDEILMGSIDLSTNTSYKLNTDGLGIGEHNIRVEYTDSEVYETISNNTKLIIRSPTTILVNTPNTNIHLTTISIGLKDYYGERINGDIIIKLPNGTQKTYTTVNGEVAANFEDLSLGENNFIIISPESEFYNEALVYLTVDVVKLNTTIISTIKNNTIGNITIEIEVLDTNNTGIIPDGIIVVKDENNNILAESNLVNGKTSIELDLDKNTHLLVVEYTGNERYNQSQTTLEIEVIPRETKITTQIINNTYKDTIIEIKLEDPVTNTPLSDAPITITLPNGTTIETITDSNGTTTVEVDVPTGENNITITYSGNNEYSNTTRIISINVDKIKTEIGVNSFWTYIGNKIELNATIKDIHGNIVNNGRVVFKINDVTLKDKTGNVLYVTVENGIARLNYTIPQTMAAKTYKFSAVYSGNEIYNGSRSNSKIINLKKRVATMTITTNTTAKIDEKITLEVNINDDIDRSTLINGYVIFKINGKTILDENNETIKVKLENNTATYTYTIPHTMSAKEHRIVAVLVNNTYQRTQANTVINIIKTPIRGVFNNIQTITPNINLKGDLKDAYNHNTLGTNKAILKINGKTLKNNLNKTEYYEVKEGKVDINFTLPSFLKEGTYVLTFVTGDRYTYTSLRTNITLNLIGNLKGLDNSNKKYVNIQTTKLITPIKTDSNIILKLTDNNQEKVDMGSIEYSHNNKIIAKSSVKEGITIFKYQFNKTGLYNITALYLENNNYHRAIAMFQVNVINTKENVNIEIPPITSHINKNTTITLHFKDNTGNRIESGNIILKIEGTKVYEGRIQEGLLEYATIFRKIGKYNLRVLYLENNRYQASQKEITFMVFKTKTRIIVDNTSFVRGENNTLQVQVIGEDGPVTRGSVRLVVNDKVLFQKELVYGFAEFNLFFNNTREYKLNVIYDKNTEYESSFFTTKIFPLQKKLFLKTEAVRVIYGEESIIVTKVIDDKKNKYPYGKMIYKINGKILKDNNGNIIFIKNTEGVFVLNHTFNFKSKKYNIRYIFADEKIRLYQNDVLEVKNKI